MLVISFRYLIYTMKMSVHYCTQFQLAKLHIYLQMCKIFTLFFTISQTGLLSVILYIILGLVALVYCINILRIFFSFKTSHFFSFLYLCTLELIPLMIIFKMVLS